jgi:hypothetical protein
MEYRQVEALAGTVDQVVGEPARAALRMRRDHDLVRREDAQLVLDREQGVGVANAAARLDAGEVQLLEEPAEARLGGPPRGILV